MSDWQPAKLVEDHPDTARIAHALYLSGAYAAVMTRGRFYIGDEEDENGCPVVYREIGDDEYGEDGGGEDEVMGLAVPDGTGGWHLGCTACRARLTEPGSGKCPECREAPKAAVAVATTASTQAVLISRSNRKERKPVIVPA